MLQFDGTRTDPSAKVQVRRTRSRGSGDPSALRRLALRRKQDCFDCFHHRKQVTDRSLGSSRKPAHNDAARLIMRCLGDRDLIEDFNISPQRVQSRRI